MLDYRGDRMRTQKTVTFYIAYKGKEQNFEVPEEMIYGCYTERSEASNWSSVNSKILLHSRQR
jgi:hypothetical protein